MFLVCPFCSRLTFSTSGRLPPFSLYIFLDAYPSFSFGFPLLQVPPPEKASMHSNLSWTANSERTDVVLRTAVNWDETKTTKLCHWCVWLCAAASWKGCISNHYMPFHYTFSYKMSKTVFPRLPSPICRGSHILVHAWFIYFRLYTPKVYIHDSVGVYIFQYLDPGLWLGLLCLPIAIMMDDIFMYKNRCNRACWSLEAS